jgi:hypothetical protein
MMDVESDPASVISDGHSGTGRGRGDSAQIAADLAAARSLQAEFQAQHSPILSAGGSTGGGAAAAAPSSSSGSVQRKLFTVPKTPVKSPRATKLSSSMKKASPAAAAASTASPAASRSVPIVTIASLIRSSSAAHVADYASERKEYEKKQLKTFKATGVVRCKILGFEQVDEEFHITYGACCAPTGNEQKNTSGSGSAPSSAGASNVNLSAFARFGQVAASGVNESSTVTRERSCGTKIQNQTYDLQQVQFMQAAGSVTIVHLPDDDIVDDSDVPPVYWVCNRLPANGGAHAVKHYFSPKMMFKLKVVDLTATADDPEPATLVMTVFDDTAKVLVGMDAAAFNDLYDRDEAGKAECIAKCQSLVGKEMLFRGEVDIKERVPHAEPGNEKQIWQNATLHVPSTNYSQVRY